MMARHIIIPNIMLSSRTIYFHTNLPYYWVSVLKSSIEDTRSLSESATGVWFNYLPSKQLGLHKHNVNNILHNPCRNWPYRLPYTVALKLSLNTEYPKKVKNFTNIYLNFQSRQINPILDGVMALPYIGWGGKKAPPG